MQVEEDPTGGKFARSAGLLNSAAHKLEDVVNFHVGDIVTSLERAILQPGGREVLVYATVMGGIGNSLHAALEFFHMLCIILSSIDTAGKIMTMH